MYALQAYLYQFKEQIPELGYRFTSANSAITGYYGIRTRRAVSAFQAKYGLIPSGIIGDEMRRAISASCIPTKTLTQASCPVPALTRSLKRGNTDRATAYEVTALQKYLYNFKDSAPMLGIGSVEGGRFIGTSNFGPLTFRALSGFQATFGISTPTGILNEATRNAIATHCVPPPIPLKVSCPNPAITNDLSNTIKQGRDLNTEGQVSALQAFLYQYRDQFEFEWGFDGYSREDLVTGRFGSKTQDLVRRFQIWFGVVSADDPEYAKVYAQTRAKIQNNCQ